jgi:ribosomal protein L30E
MNTIDAIKKALKNKTLIIGYKSTIRMVKKKKVSLVVVASNTPEKVRDEIKNLTNINKIEYVESKKDNLELGATCRKPFGVMVLSIKSEKA